MGNFLVFIVGSGVLRVRLFLLSLLWVRCMFVYFCYGYCGFVMRWRIFVTVIVVLEKFSCLSRVIGLWYVGFIFLIFLCDCYIGENVIFMYKLFWGYLLCVGCCFRKWVINCSLRVRYGSWFVCEGFVNLSGFCGFKEWRK